MDLGVRRREKNPFAFLGGFPCHFPKQQGKEDQGGQLEGGPVAVAVPLVSLMGPSVHLTGPLFPLRGPFNSLIVGRVPLRI